MVTRLRDSDVAETETGKKKEVRGVPMTHPSFVFIPLGLERDGVKCKVWLELYG